MMQAWHSRGRSAGGTLRTGRPARTSAVLTLLVPFSEADLLKSWGADGWPFTNLLRESGAFQASHRIGVDKTKYRGRMGGLLALAACLRAMPAMCRSRSVVTVWWGGKLRFCAGMVGAALKLFGLKRCQLVFLGVEGELGGRSGVSNWLIQQEFRACDVAIVNTLGQLQLFQERVPRFRGDSVVMRYSGPNSMSELPVAEEKTDAYFVGGIQNRDFATAIAGCQRAGVRLTCVASTNANLPTAEGVDVLCSIPFAEFTQRMGESRAVIIALRDPLVSAGHLVAIQALEMGKPLIISEFPGIEDYVTPGHDCLTFEAGSAESLAEALRRIERDADLRARLGAAAHETFLTRFGWKVFVDDFLQAIGQAPVPELVPAPAESDHRFQGNLTTGSS